MNRVTIRVPATTANLGPGFDAFGCALSLYTDVTFEETEAGLEDRPQEKAAPCPVALRQAGALGIQRQAEENIFFSPLAEPEGPLKRAGDGHWRME